MKPLTKTELALLTEIMDSHSRQTEVYFSGDKRWNQARRIQAMQSLRDRGLVQTKSLGIQRDIKRGPFGRLQTGFTVQWIPYVVRMLAGNSNIENGQKG